MLPTPILCYRVEYIPCANFWLIKSVCYTIATMDVMSAICVQQTTRSSHCTRSFLSFLLHRLWHSFLSIIIDVTFVAHLSLCFALSFQLYRCFCFSKISYSHLSHPYYFQTEIIELCMKYTCIKIRNNKNPTLI